MAENAARLVWAGAGVSLPKRLVTPRGVRLALRKLLGDARYRRRARDLGDWAAQNDGSGAAAELLEDLVAPGRYDERGLAPRGGFEPPRLD